MKFVNYKNMTKEQMASEMKLRFPDKPKEAEFELPKHKSTNFMKSESAWNTLGRMRLWPFNLVKRP